MTLVFKELRARKFWSNARSHLISEAKQGWAWLVSRWETTCEYQMNGKLGWHSGSVVSTVALQQKILRSIPGWGRTFLCGVCMFPTWMCEISHAGKLTILDCPQVWMFVSIDQPCDQPATCPRWTPPSSIGDTFKHLCQVYCSLKIQIHTTHNAPCSKNGQTPALYCYKCNKCVIFNKRNKSQHWRVKNFYLNANTNHFSVSTDHRQVSEV